MLNSWYYWADVPPKFHKEVFALPHPTYHGEPSVRFRGIFINDEAPALTGWVRDNFGGYGSEFYKKVFELLLRLKVGESSSMNTSVIYADPHLGKLLMASNVARLSKPRCIVLHR